MDGFEVVSQYNDGINDGSETSINTTLLGNTDLLVTTTGNMNVCDANMLKAIKSGAVVCNIGHFDNEIDTAYMRKNWEWDEVKPQVHVVYRDKAANDHLILLSEGRLVNLGNATGHPSRIMDGSFANQVLAQMELWNNAASYDKKVYVLPKHLDEKVAALHLDKLGVKLTVLSGEQASYLGIADTGPFKPEHYRY